MEVVNAWGPVLASTTVTVSLVVLLWRVMTARFDDLVARMDARFAAVDAQLASVDRRFDAIGAKFEARFDAVDAKFEARFDAVDAKFDTVDHRLSALETDMTLVKQHLLKNSAA